MSDIRDVTVIGSDEGGYDLTKVGCSAALDAEQWLAVQEHLASSTRSPARKPST